MRILIVGTAGSGKTTLGHYLSARLASPPFELDAYFWGPDWTPPDNAVFRASVEELLKGKRNWVMDGNYRSVRDIAVDAADVIIWLDCPLWICQWRLARRTARRMLRRERLFHGNRESAMDLVRTRFEFFRWAAGSTAGSGMRFRRSNGMAYHPLSSESSIDVILSPLT